MANDIDMLDLIEKFFSSDSVVDDNGYFKVYNEASLQYELGIFLRDELKNRTKLDYRVDFERNVLREPIADRGAKNEDCERRPFVKKEIDLFAYISNSNAGRFAIELKYPRKGQYQESYVNFIKDIKFMEQVAFKYRIKTYCLTLATLSTYYKVADGNALYMGFRTYDPSDHMNDPIEKKYEYSNLVSYRGPRFFLDDWFNAVNSSKGKTNRGTYWSKYIAPKYDFDIVWNKARVKSVSDGNVNYKRLCQADGYEDRPGRINPEKFPVFFYLIEIDGTKSNGNTLNK